MRENDRSERPQNRTDAKPCLSDVYKMSTRAKRRQTDVRLSGRSMVEMLGVLAIIGVLSVGAMSGYSKAMMKYKLNKQTEQINSLLFAITLYKNDFKFTGETEQQQILPYFIKMGLVPPEMITNTESYIHDVFDNSLGIAMYPTEKRGVMAINLTEPTQPEICVNLINIAKQYHDTLMNIIVNDGTYHYIYSGTYCQSYPDKDCLNNLTNKEITEYCLLLDNLQDNVGWNIFYNWKII